MAKKIFIKLLKLSLIGYAVLFLVFFFDLDGKFLYYIWEPRARAHYDRMHRKDKTKTPYEQKDDVMKEDW
ncbi:MAG: hypothetical protein UHN88_02850 [Eubacterium sp.]|nr:hypothetical protein [Eubacterium sp.]